MAWNEGKYFGYVKFSLCKTWSLIRTIFMRQKFGHQKSITVEFSYPEKFGGYQKF